MAEKCNHHHTASDKAIIVVISAMNIGTAITTKAGTRTEEGTDLVCVRTAVSIPIPPAAISSESYPL